MDTVPEGNKIAAGRYSGVCEDYDVFTVGEFDHFSEFFEILK